MKETDYSKLNPNDFTQKDLMLHLLQVAQHSATREDVKSDIAELKIDIDKIDEKFDKVDAKFDKVYEKIDKVDAKFDKIQWLIIATMMTVLFKDYIFSLLQAPHMP
jgi:peptidoglycan hydrolase CwlO-like protein